MSVIDITNIEEVTPEATIDIPPPETEEIAPESEKKPEEIAPENIPLVIPADTNTPPMSSEPVTSLLDITEATSGIDILNMSGTADAIMTPPIEEAAPEEAATPADPISATIDLSPIVATIAPISGSLGDKIGGFADELRGLKAADEILLQEKQDAKKRLEDAKKAIEDAEKALDTEIQRIRDDEAAIDDTLASLKKR
jgi:hypothetical protein